jgi:hypothetical protein
MQKMLARMTRAAASQPARTIKQASQKTKKLVGRRAFFVLLGHRSGPGSYQAAMALMAADRRDL